MARTLRLIRRNRKASMNRKKVVGKKSKVARKNRTRRRVKLFRGGAPKQKQNILLIIDPQRDFCDIDETFTKQKGPNGEKFTPLVVFNQSHLSAGLPVPGAKNDLERLCAFLQENHDSFDEIHVSLDSHTNTHIGHIDFWTPPIDEQDKLKDFALPIPLQLFIVDDVIVDDVAITTDTDSYYTKYPIFLGDASTKTKLIDEKRAYAKTPELHKIAYHYIKMMQDERKNNPSKPIPCLWAKHCVIGDTLDDTPTDGWKLYEPLRNILEEKFKGKVFFHEKGTNDLVEMYSIFSAEVSFDSLMETHPILKDSLPEEYKNLYLNAKLPDVDQQTVDVPNPKRNYVTTFNTPLFERLMDNNNNVFVCGEAKSHCVKTSVEDMVNYINVQKDKPYSARQIYVFDDMTSIIPGYENNTISAYRNLSENKVNIIRSENFTHIIGPVYTSKPFEETTIKPTSITSTIDTPAPEIYYASMASKSIADRKKKQQRVIEDRNLELANKKTN